MKEEKVISWEEQASSKVWIPEKEGEELIGVVKGIDEGLYGRQFIIEDNKGIEHRTPSHKVLVARMTNVEIGNMVKLIFVKSEPPKVRGQNPTRIYSVYIGK